MLKHEDASEALSQSAAKVRVTPEELATALSRIEAQKDADQRHSAGSIPIGEAVQQLGLDVTPEEVLAEVQAGRRLAVPRKKETLFGRHIVLALGLAGVLLGLAVDGNGLRQIRSQETPATVSVSSAAAMPIQLDPHLMVSTAARKLVALSKVKDNQPVRCTLSNAHGRLSFYQWTPGTTAQNSWTLIKHGGKVYVRGWTRGTPPSRMETEGLELHAYSNRVFCVPITLPLQGFQALPYDNSEVRFTTVNIRLDGYAYEKWQP